jgi:hypothetical protein
MSLLARPASGQSGRSVRLACPAQRDAAAFHGCQSNVLFSKNVFEDTI